MRFCNVCGNAIGNERFCNKCGADNGEASTVGTSSIPGGAPESGSVFASSMNQLDLNLILHWAAVGLFSIAAIVLFFSAVAGGMEMVADSILYKGNIIIAIVGYIFGMWGIIPAVISGLIYKNNENKLIVSVAISMLFLMIVLLILCKIGSKPTGLLGGFSEIFKLYTGKKIGIIILDVLAAAAGIAGMQIKK